MGTGTLNSDSELVAIVDLKQRDAHIRKPVVREAKRMGQRSRFTWFLREYEQHSLPS